MRGDVLYKCRGRLSEDGPHPPTHTHRHKAPLTVTTNITHRNVRTSNQKPACISLVSCEALLLVVYTCKMHQNRVLLFAPPPLLSPSPSLGDELIKRSLRAVDLPHFL